MKTTFDQLCEEFGVIRQTKRIMYPRQIKFSPEFIAALHKEFQRQQASQPSDKPIRDITQKFLKALQFHLVDVDQAKPKVPELKVLPKLHKPVTTPERSSPIPVGNA